MSTFILHPLSNICLLHFLSTHLHFVSTKLHFYGLFASFVFFPLSICILEALFLCFGYLLCSLHTFILQPQSFIYLLRLLPFFPCPPPFCISKILFVCFVYSLYVLPTFILHPRSFIFLFFLFFLFLANLLFVF
jgi:hypothetical protein